ncbi:MAG: proline--tRNA ligase [Candidatus Doudnabacteria bacterium]|nr:proline--tRNA ligase [Candidatus Doudnabacteria bacterium]
MNNQTFSKKHLTKKTDDISEWYNDVVLRAGLVEYSDVKGCLIIKPNGYALWESVQKELDLWFKADGVKNVYFPLFIPMSLLQKEADHLEGFSPELAVVEYAGGEKLHEPLAIRPTSETIMYKTFADWVQSHRDLPLKVNQWCNVVRWEKRTYPFLRTSEFLWQEGHTVHKNAEEADAMAQKALGWYQKFYEEFFAMSPYVGIKSETEKFAGAKRTYSVELVMPDGKALQAATSHDLGDNFAKVFGIEYLDENNQKQLGYQTSWGFSTRSIGGLVLTHGDDAGLILPPKVAPTQVVIVVIGNKQDAENPVEPFADEIAEELRAQDLRVIVDVNYNNSLGRRINNWELEGVPLRLEIGAKEMEQNQVTSVRRDTFEKQSIDRANITATVISQLDTIQTDLLEKSKKLKTDKTKNVNSFEEFKQAMDSDKSFIRMYWCESLECEKTIKDATKATPRVLELENMAEQADEKCLKCGNPAQRQWLFAQSY